MQLLAFILFIYMNFYIIKIAKRNKMAKNILYFVRAKNYSNIFFSLFSILYFIYIGIDIHDNIIKNGIHFNLDTIDIFNFIILIVSLITIFILFISSLILLFMKSVIYDDSIILSDGVFKMDTIKKVEKIKDNNIKIYLKKYSPFALLGYKTFYVNKNELDIIYDYISNGIGGA